MLDVKLITFHKSLSYGGCLQAYATVRILESLGCDVTVIDFENPYEARNRNGELKIYGTYKERFISLIKEIFFKNQSMKEKAFGAFTQIYPNMTTKHYNNVSEMDDIFADVLVVGSDQVWNGKITNNIEPAFFLNFGSAKKRISFSSSMGSYQLSIREKEQVKGMLKNFTSISTREEFARKQIQTLTSKEVKILLDPTLLIDKDSWIKDSANMENGYVKGSYILAFVINEHKENIAEIFKKYKRKLGLPIYRIRLNTYRSRGEDRVIAGPTPLEFIRLISNAYFVITDSFHGTAFSINLNVPFAFIRVENNNDRMQELLKHCSLEDRTIRKDYIPETTCDFTTANSYLEEQRRDNIEWLRESIL
jgi:hypothetical protein